MAHYLRLGVHAAKLAVTFTALCAAVLALSRCAAPSSTDDLQPRYSAAELAAETAARNPVLNESSPPVAVVPVDYGTLDATWRPRRESPLLGALADRGQLPRVAERTGPEPLVLQGPEGVGRYGGAWTGYAQSATAVFEYVNARMSSSSLVRWSPQGYPVVPHLAKAWTVSADFRQFTFSLRRGIRWSDGHPFTAEDVLYWWTYEVPQLAVFPRALIVGDQRGKLEKLDEYTIRFSFPIANPNFIERIADMTLGQPAHYLRQYHPEVGDQALIAQEASRIGISPQALYSRKTKWSNPDCPRMWPWVARRYQSTPPYQFVRNPYFWAVDTAGNQLPYIDMLYLDVRTKQMSEIAAASGAVTFSTDVRNRNFTLVMSQRRRAGYEVLQWYPGSRSPYNIFPNLNRRIDTARPDTRQKNQLLNEVRFRRALSLAINRRDIIKAVFNGVTEPAQLAPGEQSAFPSASLQQSYIAFDRAQSNRLLDELGLSRRDAEGFRQFSDGSRMTFFLSELFNTTEGPSQFVIDDWAAVGVRVRLQKAAWNVLYAQRYAYDYDLIVSAEESGESEAFPLLQPSSFVPTQQTCLFAPGYGLWFASGGLRNKNATASPGAFAPPLGHPLRDAMMHYVTAVTTVDPIEQRRAFGRVLDIAAEQVWSIGICTPPPKLVVISDGLRNVPRVGLIANLTKTPSNAAPETFYWDNPSLSPATIEALQADIVSPTSDPGITPPASAVFAGGTASRRVVGWVTAAFSLAALLGLGWRYAFLGRRLLGCIPTLGIMSVLIFAVVQLPPGDFLETRIMQLEMESNESAVNDIKELQEVFHVSDPLWKKYCRWTGLLWLTSFSADDEGLLQGNLGRSMESNRPVSEIMGDRLLLTCLLSGLTLVVTWGIALPIGIYSAVRQYSAVDYFLSIIGFLGVSVPAFLLALVVMYLGSRWLGISMTGLFSPEFAVQPGWSLPKLKDMLQHLWMPVAVLSVGGTAAMIRVMRGNLLDELRKPYVTTARAKGVRPLRLVLKYPVRVAINPFVSSIGSLLPELISGGTIVAVVMGLPTIGPFLLSALQDEDVYLAASMLMILSVLSVIGTLLSDLLLLLVDPRIRMNGGSA